VRPRDERYLLRVWRDGDGAGAARASLRHLETSEQHHFADLERLLDFLHRDAPRGHVERPPAVRTPGRASDRRGGARRGDHAGLGSDDDGDAGTGRDGEP
jgi:hypothetical protein